MSKLLKYSFYLIFITLAILPKTSNAQDVSSLTSLVNKESVKAVEKAISMLAEADKLTVEANNLYNEAIALQSNYDLDEKTLQKKLSKAEGNAVSTQIKADKAYAEAYYSLYEICAGQLKASKVSYGESGSLEADAALLMEQARDKRKQAESVENVYEKAAVFNEASSFENAAIDNMILALQIQQGTAGNAIYPEESVSENVILPDPVSETTVPYTTPSPYEYSTGVEQKSENLAVDHTMIEKYNAYINDPSIPDPILVNRAGVSGVDDVSVEGARTVFMGGQVQEPEYTQTIPADTAQYIQDVEVTDQIVAEITQEPVSESIAPSETYLETSSSLAGSAATYAGINSSVQNTDLSFVVQVGASRIFLTRSQVQAIYSGKHTIEIVEDEGWYKYWISGFRLFSEANRVAVESGVKDAFVQAYNGGSLMMLYEAKELTRVLEADVQRYGRKALKNPVDFYVQVVASRIRLDDKKLAEFCGDGGTCRIIIEEGWFKYQVYAGTEYSLAQSLKAKFASDAFIVAYEKGLKQELYKAINSIK